MKCNIKSNLCKVLLLGIFCIAAITPSAAVNAKKSPVLSHKKITLQVGKKKQLKVKYTKSKVRWKSSKVKIASVTSKGKVTARKKGNAIITAKVGKKTLRCAVVVKPKSITKNTDTNPSTEMVQPVDPQTTEKVQPTEDQHTDTPTTESKKIPDIMDPETKDKGWTGFY